MMSPIEHAGEPGFVIWMYVSGSSTISLFSLLPTEYVISPGRRGVSSNSNIGSVALPQSGGTLISMSSEYYVLVNPTIAVTVRP
jgi:hypothetical protein